MRKALFTLDSVDETEGGVTPFEGYTHGDDWNGWATPYFGKDEAMRLIAALNKVMEQASFYSGDLPFAWYDPAKDAFVTLYENDLSEVDEWQGIQVEVHGQTLTLYAIGAYCWTWNLYRDEVIDPELQTELDKLNAALAKAGANWQSYIVAQGDTYSLRNQDEHGNSVGQCTEPYSHQGIVRFMRMLTIHMRVADE